MYLPYFLCCYILAIRVGEKREITIVTLKAVKTDGPCTVTITTPSGKNIEMKLAQVTEGYSTFFQPTEEGKHTVTITYGYMSVPKSPFTVIVEVAIDLGQVKVIGLETRKYQQYHVYTGARPIYSQLTLITINSTTLFAAKLSFYMTIYLQE